MSLSLELETLKWSSDCVLRLPVPNSRGLWFIDPQQMKFSSLIITSITFSVMEKKLFWLCDSEWCKGFSYCKILIM